jgi:phosphate/sulfate permease
MDATLSLFALLALISVALIFDLLNGLHDAANSIATVVSTRVLRPQYAVIWAAFFNFIAFCSSASTSRKRLAPESWPQMWSMPRSFSARSWVPFAGI